MTCGLASTILTRISLQGTLIATGSHALGFICIYLFIIICIVLYVYMYGLSVMLGGWAIVVKCCKTEDDLAAQG